MKQYKIFIVGNYLRITDVLKKEDFYGHRKKVEIDPSNTGVQLYRFFNVKDWDSNLSLKLSQIVKEDGQPYTIEEWETFYTENTGNFNGGVTAPELNTTLNNYQLKSEKGQPNGYVPTNANNTIDPIFLPSYVDDILEFANLSTLPVVGETGKIYVTLDTNLQYRWSGSIYVPFSGGGGNFVDKVNNQLDIAGEKKFTTSIESPIVTVSNDGAIKMKSISSNSDLSITYTTDEFNLGYNQGAGVPDGAVDSIFTVSVPNKIVTFLNPSNQVFFNFSSLTDVRNFVFRDLSGTVALLSDFTDFEPLHSENSVKYETDFLVSSTGVPTFPFTPTASLGGTFSNNNANIDPNHPGIFRITSSVNAGSGVRLVTENNAIQTPINGAEFIAVFNIPVVSGTNVKLGFHDVTSNGDSTDGFYLSLEPTGLFFKTANNGVRTTSALMADATPNAWYKVKINIGVTGGRCTLYDSNGVQIGLTQVITTNIPTTSARLYGAGAAAYTSNSAISALLDIDYMSVKFNNLIR